MYIYSHTYVYPYILIHIYIYTEAHTCLIHTNTYKYIRIHTNTYKYIKHKYIQLDFITEKDLLLIFPLHFQISKAVIPKLNTRYLCASRVLYKVLVKLKQNIRY